MILVITEDSQVWLSRGGEDKDSNISQGESHEQESSKRDHLLEIGRHPRLLHRSAYRIAICPDTSSILPDSELRF
jgi:hypothetical protein